MKLPATVLLLTWRMNLGINFGICQGKLENFRGTIMGSLVINVTEADRERVTAWLTDRGILWEVLENV